MKRQNMVELTLDFNQKQGLIFLSQPQVLVEQSPKSWKIIILRAMNAISLIFSILLFVFSRKPSANMNECLKNTSVYCKSNFVVCPFQADLIILTPILDEVEIPIFTLRINGTFFTPEHPSIARQDPSSEVDELWKDLEILRTVVVTKDDIIKWERTPKTSQGLTMIIGVSATTLAWRKWTSFIKSIASTCYAVKLLEIFEPIRSLTLLKNMSSSSRHI